MCTHRFCYTSHQMAGVIAHIQTLHSQFSLCALAICGVLLRKPGLQEPPVISGVRKTHRRRNLAVNPRTFLLMCPIPMCVVVPLLESHGQKCARMFTCIHIPLCVHTHLSEVWGGRELPLFAHVRPRKFKFTHRLCSRRACTLK